MVIVAPHQPSETARADETLVTPDHTRPTRSTTLRAGAVVVVLAAAIIAVALWVTGTRDQAPVLNGADATRAANALAQEPRTPGPRTPSRGDAASRAANDLARQPREPLPVTSGADAARDGNVVARDR